MEDLSYSDSIVVSRSPDVLYQMVSDVTRMGEWSPVCTSCRWEDDARGEGAWFTGRNETSSRTWETRSQVVVDEPGREFTFEVGGSRARWGYRFEAEDGGTRVTESWDFLPAGIAFFEEHFGADAEAEIADRVRAARSGIPATLAALKRAAEAE